MSQPHSAPPRVVNGRISIQAPASKVWEVLTHPDHIRQWDALPDNFGNAPLQPGTVLEWPGFSRLTVTVFEPVRQLELSLHSPRWKSPPTDHQIAYTYMLAEEEGGTQLSLRFGDLGSLPDDEASAYREAGEEFCETALPEIKRLAEEQAAGG
jgi:uncharacterized protein YndB with AHSA1/START domain